MFGPRKHIRQLLEGYRIGSLSEADAKRAEEESSFTSYYQDDPEVQLECRNLCVSLKSQGSVSFPDF